MIVVKLSGGLGNQMFQYAFGRALSIRSNTTLFLDTSGLNDNIHTHTKRNFELTHFLIQATISSNSFITYKKNVFNFPVFILNLFRKKKILKQIVEQKLHFDSSIKNTFHNAYFIGYWNSYKYFNDYADFIKKDFSFNLILDERNKLIAKKIQTAVSVSLHIRRGDYITNPETKAYHGTCDLEYYKKAVAILKEKYENLEFFVFSDDPEWVKQNFIIDANFIIVSSTENSNGLQDMYLMTLCKHAIIANSTYSWWAAWLINNDNKTVIAPLKWYNNSIDTADLFPNSWIRI